ncbi:MAG: hypothetical protein GTN69_04650 [Armatimonadetes bacterium]|nr:hypothetical protein [Armatimonadota bacterium]NIO75175.1 hypothetical protein [Armatimonadota bacterium]NIO98576.1 hypothetical protein [Armatimonadota bacterium]
MAWKAVVKTLLAVFLIGALFQGGCRRSTQEMTSEERGTSGTPMTWLRLRWGGGLAPGSGESLTIDTDGRVRAVLGLPRENGYIGTFELTLPKARLAELRKAVNRANLYSMRDYYPPAKGSYDFTVMTLTVASESEQKQVRATSASWFYPPGLKRLFDLTNRLPGTEHTTAAPDGILSLLILEVSTRPVSAIGVEIQVPKRSFRVGEPIDVTVVVKNVGKNPVVLPSPSIREVAGGHISVQLRHVPLPPEEAAAGIDRAAIRFGESRSEVNTVLSDRAKGDLENVVRIEPGEKWAIRMPKALAAPSPGEYELIGSLDIYWHYECSALAKELGEGLVDGYAGAKSVPLTISK